MSFQDHFSQLAGNYSRYRPHYPPALFAYLASLTPAHELAWDCGTGNGQAAIGLAPHFERVFATDASREQIRRAQPHPGVEYQVGPAEKAALPDACCDLVTVAIAVHWFDHDRFYPEVKRVLKPGGALAVWGYSFPRIGPEIDQVTLDYHNRVLADYWPERYHYVAESYRTLPFPFAEVAPPALGMQADWTLDQFCGFLSSWSASQRYLEQTGWHPLEEIWEPLAGLWGDPARPRQVTWQIYMRVGKR